MALSAAPEVHFPRPPGCVRVPIGGAVTRTRRASAGERGDALLLQADPRTVGPSQPVDVGHHIAADGQQCVRRLHLHHLAVQWSIQGDAHLIAARVVRALLAAEPGLSAKAIAKRLHISDSTASKYRRLLESERQGIEPAQQQMAQ